MQISILGCGWLGLPLAQTLLQRGHTVKGSTTREEKLATLQEHGITPYLIRFDPEINNDYQPDFFDSEVLIVNIPPKRSEEATEVYPRQIASLLEVIEKSPVKKVAVREFYFSVSQREPPGARIRCKRRREGQRTGVAHH